MESSNSFQGQLKKISQELSRLKTDLHLTREHLKSILQNSKEMIFAIDGKGTGLGLPICQNIMKRLGGSI